MKKIIILFILILFKTNSYSEISQYKIAGVRLHQSILEIMTEDEIIENAQTLSVHSDRYAIIKYNKDLNNLPEAKNYDMIYLTIDINDENYPIVSITLYKEYGTDFNLCMKEQKLIAQKYEKIFKIKKKEFPIKDFSDKYGPGSKWKAIVFEKPNFKTIKSDTASVLCYHYGMSKENELHGQDNLKVNILTRDFADAATVR